MPNRIGLALTAAVSLIASGAQAQAVFRGDCPRANRFLQNEPVNTHFLPRYRGVMRNQTADGCVMSETDLRRRSESSTRVTFDFTEATTTGSGCLGAGTVRRERYGTLTLTKQVTRLNDHLCELVIVAVYQITDRSTGESYSFEQRALPLGSSRHFALVSTDHQYAELFSAVP